MFFVGVEFWSFGCFIIWVWFVLSFGFVGIGGFGSTLRVLALSRSSWKFDLQLIEATMLLVWWAGYRGLGRIIVKPKFGSDKNRYPLVYHLPISWILQGTMIPWLEVSLGVWVSATFLSGFSLLSTSQIGIWRIPWVSWWLSRIVLWVEFCEQKICWSWISS